MRLDPHRAADHLDRLYRTAILITQDPHEAEDLVQDTYEQILRRPRELKGDSELHYMRAAMRRRHIDRHREAPAASPASSSTTRPSRAPAPARTRRCAPSRPRSSPPSARSPRSTATSSSPRTSPASTYTEAADALGCKRGTIMSRVYRAREALVKSLDGDKIAA